MRKLLIVAAFFGVMLATACTTVVENATDIAIGPSAACLINDAGGVECWGTTGAGVDYGATATAVTQIPSGATDIQIGANHICAIVSGDVQCWGDNAEGQLGDGTGVASATPVNVVGLPPADAPVELATTGSHTCVRLDSGAVGCWGRNGDGQLGDGTTVNRLSPVVVTGFNGTPGNKARDISVGSAYSCANKTNFTVECWGSDADGHLGNGPGQTDSAVPAAVPGLTDVIFITSGVTHTCSTSPLGTLQCWGKNQFGEIDPAGGVVEAPTTYGSFSGVAISLSTSRSRTCAVVVGGTAECVGDNTFGGLGAGSNVASSSTPLTVSGTGVGPQEVTKIVSSGDNGCVLGITGRVACWGFGGNGANGNDSFNNTNVPVQVLRG